MQQILMCSQLNNIYLARGTATAPAGTVGGRCYGIWGQSRRENTFFSHLREKLQLQFDEPSKRNAINAHI